MIVNAKINGVAGKTLFHDGAEVNSYFCKQNNIDFQSFEYFSEMENSKE